MGVILESIIAPNTGQAFTMLTGQCISISAVSIVDFVAFNLHDLRERFDQARTKADQGKIFISTGDFLISKLNNDMFKIVEDTFTQGTPRSAIRLCAAKDAGKGPLRTAWPKRPILRTPKSPLTISPTMDASRISPRRLSPGT